MGIEILSCGAGMQSTALALMSCENAMSNKPIHPLVPIYDAVIYCDLGYEPPWVYDQVDFIRKACEQCGIRFKILYTGLYDHYLKNFGESRTCSVPFWSIGPDGKEAKMRRNCTIDFKINAIHKFARYELLGYKKYQRTRSEDIGAHEMHIGFSAEERQRVFNSYNPLFINRFPLVEMELERADNYKYILEVWGLDTKASACCICPFHRNYFFEYLKKNHGDSYNAILTMDRLLEDKQPQTKIKSQLFISRSRKRIERLTPSDCNDAECFRYKGKNVWNGF